MAVTTKAESEIMEVLHEAKKLAQRYYALTGRPLGVTGEVAEYEAARILGIKLTPARNAGYDGIVRGRRIQIKGRVATKGRLGTIDLKKEWDAVWLVLLDNKFNTIAIYEASREALIGPLTRPGSRSRNERGQLAISQFKAVAKRRWPEDKKQAATKR